MMKPQQTFIQKKSIARQLAYTIVGLSLLYVMGFFGLYLASREQLGGLSELHNLSNLNTSVAQIRTVLTRVRQIVEEAGTAPISEVSQLVVVNANDQIKNIFDQELEAAEAYPQIKQAILSSHNSFELVKNSLPELFLAKTVSRSRVLEFSQYAIELQDQLAQIQLEISGQSDAVFQGIYIRRFFPLSIGLIFAVLSFFLALVIGFRIRKHVMVSLRALIDTIQRVAQSQFDTPSSIVAADEIGRLAHGLNNMTEALKETTVSKSFVESIIESIMDPIIVTDAKGNITRVNKTTLSKFGYSEDRLLDSNISLFFTDFSETPSPMRAVEKVCVDSQGNLFLATLSVSSVGLKNEMPSFVYVIEDITERKNFEETLKKQNAILASVNKELEAFSYSVSHDLRAPLRAIDTFSQAMQDDYFNKLDSEGRENLERIRKGVQKMGILIEDLLNLARFSKAEVELSEINLSDFAKDIAEEYLRNQPERKVVFRIEENVKAVADPGLLKVVLSNLIGNAWKYTSKKDSSVIEFGHIKKLGKEIYFVKDDGAGFDMSYSSKLFRAFQRLHSVSEFPGTGIGLAIVQRIINRHGGRLWAEGKPNEGAIFYFSL